MAVARLRNRYIEVAALVVISGLIYYVVWIRSSCSFNYCTSDSAKETLSKPECPVNAMLCGVKTRQLNFTTLRLDFHELMTTIDFQCPTLQRFGRAGDGGYEACMSKAIRPDNNNCLVYSFGISNDWSFDEDWAKYGCEVHSFDPSIGLEDHVHSANVTFHKLGLWGNDYENHRGWQLERLSTIRKRLGHQERIIDALKIDIEGGEWSFLRDVIDADSSPLSYVRQLYIELHTPTFRYVRNMTASDFAEISEYVMRLRDDLDFLLYKNVQRNYCCGRFSDLMPPGVTEKCCHELFFFNARLIAA